MTSRPPASVARVSSTAAALLLTTVQASAPVSSQTRDSIRSSRSPRPPSSRSYSRLAGAVMAATTASTASCGSRARPRLVCSTVPVRLKTVRSRGAKRRARRRPAAWTTSVMPGAPASGSPDRSRSCASARICARDSRTAWVQASRPWRSRSASMSALNSTLSTAGRRSADGEAAEVAAEVAAVSVMACEGVRQQAWRGRSARRRPRPAPRQRPRRAGDWRWRAESASPRPSAGPASARPGRRPGARPSGPFPG